MCLMLEWFCVWCGRVVCLMLEGYMFEVGGFVLDVGGLCA